MRKLKDQIPAIVTNTAGSYVSEGKWRSCSRKALRVDIRGSNCPVYITYPELSTVKFPVFTLAELGARYFTQGMRVSTLKGHEIQTCLHFGPLECQVKSRLAYDDANSAAIEFIDPPETARQMIRDMFELELIAASLVPYHNFNCPNPGSTHTTVYSDGSAHNLEFFLTEDRLDGIAGRLAVLDVRFAWSRTRPTLFRITGLSDERTQGPHFKKRLASFIRNLQDLDPRVRQAIEKAIASC